MPDHTYNTLHITMSTFSYSAAARQATPSEPKEVASPAAAVEAAAEPSTEPSAAQPSAQEPPMAGPSTTPAVARPEPSKIQHLILDAGPLLSLTPVRHLATTFHTTPLVLAELRDPKAREHWEHLKLTGVDVRVEPPSPAAMAKVVAFAKKTGDFAVLSQTDLSVVALTYQYEALVNGVDRIRTEPGQVLAPLDRPEEARAVEEEEEDEDEDDDEEEVELEAEEGTEAAVEAITKTTAELATDDKEEAVVAAAPAPSAPAKVPGWDEDDEDEGGAWITPSNVNKHRSHDLGLLPDDKGASAAPLAAACMTGDYAVQNVLLGMGLGLVGEAGKRISKVRSWVLRCHACFKICKDSSKRFCPSCGNATLMRTTVSTDSVTGKQTIHLKKNFQYHLRGTKYSIPDPKPGRAKGQIKAGSGLILREDQAEWQDAVRVQRREREKEEKRAARGDGSWMDPDVSG